MTEKMNGSRRPAWMGWAILGVCIVATFALGLLASTILERRAERSIAQVQMLKPIKPWETDNTIWGVSFPRQYRSWESTKDMDEATMFGGSSKRDYLEANPRLVVLWAGYPFAKEYDQARGHFHSLDDVNNTARTSEKTPATCWTCKTPDAPRLMSEMGPDKFYEKRKSEFKDQIKSPIGCADCHNNETMALQISRPAIVEAFERKGKDINKASHQDKRSLACAQCHSEYYFRDTRSNYLVFPWDEGMTAEDFEKYYYKDGGHVDWVHAISGAKMVKMQHPDYEVYSQGIHAFRNVACADCHMPYKTEGGIKFTDHQIRSPLYNVEASCQTCHRWSENEIVNRVNGIQVKTRMLLDMVEDSIVAAHLEIGDAMKRGATDQQLEEVRTLVSKAQMYWDYIASTNGMGFHAPQESARVLGKALNFAQDCRVKTTALRARLGTTEPVSLPDLSSKERAQNFIKPFVDEAEMRKKYIDEKAIRPGA